MYFKKVLFILFLHVTFQSIAQNDTLTNVDCNEGYQQAILDSESGFYRVSYFLGYLMSEDWAVNIFHTQYLLDNYNITLEGVGCGLDAEILCYYEKMRALVYLKYGDDIFERSRKEAIKFYDIK